MDSSTVIANFDMRSHSHTFNNDTKDTSLSSSSIRERLKAVSKDQLYSVYTHLQHEIDALPMYVFSLV